MNFWQTIILIDRLIPFQKWTQVLFWHSSANKKVVLETMHTTLALLATKQWKLTTWLSIKKITPFHTKNGHFFKRVLFKRLLLWCVQASSTMEEAWITLYLNLSQMVEQYTFFLLLLLQSIYAQRELSTQTFFSLFEQSVDWYLIENWEPKKRKGFDSINTGEHFDTILRTSLVVHIGKKAS